ncbi:hypothetical protein KP509_27G015600 [Ceratopteris richardii]|uniref:AP2/ERF domain-containing protein n=1 Tax=Ceratopteris richardii TaxID=49495 RepID=A0A8T2RFY3_CERRI|nr:hypothetical protein KP509_27G015600 [Ceratopteris richardii]
MAASSFRSPDSALPSPASSPSVSGLQDSPHTTSDRTPPPPQSASTNPLPRKKRPSSGGGSGEGAGVRSKPFRGVRMRSWGKWVSEIRQPKKRSRIWLGSYSTPEAAAQAYDMALYYLRGPLASLNFPTLIPQEEPPNLSPRSVQQKAIAAGVAADKKGRNTNGFAALPGLPAIVKGKTASSRSNSQDSCSSSHSHHFNDGNNTCTASTLAPNADMRFLCFHDDASAMQNPQACQQRSHVEPETHHANVNEMHLRAACQRSATQARQGRPLTLNLNELAPEEPEELTDGEYDDRSHSQHHSFGDHGDIERVPASCSGSLLNGLDSKSRPFMEFLAPRSSSASR